MLLALVHTTSAQDKTQNKVDWNGYTQLRFTTNFNDVHSFAMRRMKLWIHSTPAFNQHWGFKVQTTITSNQNEKFLLQDVEAFYKNKNFRLNIGQFIPHYSLQRFQPDYEVPLTERAGVINALIPDGTLGVRDIGIEGSFQNSDKNFETWLGIFNGNGIKEYRLANNGFMISNKTDAYFFSRHLNVGFSLMFRKADNLQLSKILPDSVLYSGNDFRYNFFAEFQYRIFQIQAEYLFANLNNDIADGYYVLGQINLGKNQIVASYNQYNDLIESTDNLPEIHLAYNYLLNHDKLKLMLDNWVQVKGGKLENYYATLQFQIFFN